MSWYGTPNKLYRNGNISINETSVYTILLDNPIADINGKGALFKNMLTIDNLSGVLTNNILWGQNWIIINYSKFILIINCSWCITIHSAINMILCQLNIIDY